MIDRAAISALIPHADRMCLLDRVTAWDQRTIHCIATSHRDPANPLVEDGWLGAACGVEYAAQAMAVHGGLIAAVGAQPRVGYLASLRAVVFEVPRLDDLEGELVIVAECLAGEADRMIYRFEVRAAGRSVLHGRAAVVLDGGNP
ncbi:MAG: 3-hydroxylacyl-ACP dehydratase [Gammaproteobacteria bacterium]|nr:3-hydroxylacyl-ACP dehydratase [Gammaproteobacteria bacterium]MBI5615132.1 3-hydroxylacyl-ACP dehydratase [Gammaproteobacteria bacterium]